MVSQALRGVWVSLGVLVATGCFDVHSVATGPVETGPSLIDDFEDGNVYPTDPTFQRWMCGKSPLPSGSDYECKIDGTGYQGSMHSVYVDETIGDLPDGKPQDGVLLGTATTMARDLRPFSQLVFAAMVEAVDLPLQSPPTLDVQIGCTSAKVTDGTPTPIYVSYHTDAPLSWQLLKVDFRMLNMPLPPVDGGAVLTSQFPAPPSTGCLMVADSIRFVASAGLPDGQSGRLVMHIDDVELK